MADFNTLWEGYIAGTLTTEQASELLHLLEAQPALWETATAGLLEENTLTGLAAPGEQELIYRHILERTHARRPRVLRLWARVAAAVIAGLLLTGIWYREQHVPQPVATQLPALKPGDVAPGSQGAILTLADGSRVTLDSAGNGIVASQGSATAVLSNGQLQYQQTATPSVSLSYNIITTPNGRQFQAILPDGTKVWLNSASTIRYPTTFTGTERSVTITGEVFFDVAANSHQPFIVHINNQAVIEVLGTQFNVNAYENEATLNTTLLQGAIQLTAGNRQVLMKPGQQAQLSSDIRVVDHVDIDRVIAWKNGLFNFEGVHLTALLRELERWYDIEVVVEKGVPDITFVGKMSRNTTLQGVLKNLEDLGVHFRLENGRRLVVTP